MADNSLNAQNAKRRALREEGSMYGIDKNLLRNRPLKDIEKTVAAYRQSITPERKAEIEAERKAEIKVAIDDALKRREAPAPPGGSDPGQWQQPRPAPAEPAPSTTTSTPFRPMDVPKVNPAEVYYQTPYDFDQPTIASALVASDDGAGTVVAEWTPTIGSEVGGVLVQQSAGDTPAFVAGAIATAQVLTIDAADDTAKWIAGVPLIPPTIPSALVASAANTPVWTSGISPGVGGVLVQQAAGSTPDFVSGTASTKEVLYKAASTAAWVAGMPVPLPSTDDYLLQGDGTNNAVWSNDIPSRVTTAESDITTIETKLATNGCAVNTYLKSNGTQGFQCGPISTAAKQLILSSAAGTESFVSAQLCHLGDGADSVVLGVAADADAADTVAIGHTAVASVASAIAIGNTAIASEASAIAIGNTANVSDVSAIAIGHAANASQASAIAIGNSPDATADDAIAIGTAAQATAADTIAIGSQAGATGTNAVAIGHSVAAGANIAAIGTANTEKLTITASNGRVDNVSAAANPHYAINGTPGIDATVVLAAITGGGSNGSLTVVGGLITAYTAPT